MSVSEPTATPDAQGEAGFALFNTIIISMVLASISISITLAMQRGSLRLLDQHATAQARLYLDSIEGLVPQLFDTLMDPDQPVALTQDWAVVQEYQIDRGTVWGQASDLQGRFNLSWLKGSDAADAVAAFERLCVSLGLETQDAANIVSAIRTSDQGADLAAAAALGVGAAVWPVLKPLVAELPEQAALNINTAPREVLEAMVPVTDDVFWQQFMAYRSRQPLARVEELRFRTRAVLEKSASDAILWSKMGVTSVYFEVRIAARLGDRVLGRYLVLIHDEETEILSRRPDYDLSASQATDL